MTFNGHHNFRIYSPDPPPGGGMLTRIGDWVKDLFRPAPDATARSAFREPTPFPLLSDELNEARERRTARTATGECDSPASDPAAARFPDRTSRPGH